MSPIRTKALAFLDLVPLTVDVTSNGSTAALFTRLTGMSHGWLQGKWAEEAAARQERLAKGKSTEGVPKTTSCNSFVAQLSVAIGLKTQIGQFDIKAKLIRAGYAAAWIPADSGARPSVGDVFKAKKTHMGVSLDFEGDIWLTVEGGQGGPGQDYTKGFDKVCRKREPWDPSQLEGWVDIEILARLTTDRPKWVIGWWQFDCAGGKEWVYLSAKGDAQAFTDAPASLKMPPTRPGRKGALTFDDDQQGLSIDWANPVDGPDVLRHLPAVGYMLGSRGAKSLQAFKR